MEPPPLSSTTFLPIIPAAKHKTSTSNNRISPSFTPTLINLKSPSQLSPNLPNKPTYKPVPKTNQHSARNLPQLNPTSTLQSSTPNITQSTRKSIKPNSMLPQPAKKMLHASKQQSSSSDASNPSLPTYSSTYLLRHKPQISAKLAYSTPLSSSSLQQTKKVSTTTSYKRYNSSDYRSKSPPKSTSTSLPQPPSTVKQRSSTHCSICQQQTGHNTQQTNMSFT